MNFKFLITLVNSGFLWTIVRFKILILIANKRLPNLRNLRLRLINQQLSLYVMRSEAFSYQK